MPEQALNSPTGSINGDHRFTQLDTSRNRIDENILLQEISKKYILIPKLAAAKQQYDNDYTKKITPKIEENADWKSKYDILDKLKRDEKEQDNSSRQEDFKPDRVIAKIYSKEHDITPDDGPLLEYKNDIPVKLTSEDQIPYGLQGLSKNNAGIEQTHLYANQLNDAITDNNHRNIKNNVHNDNTQINTYGENSIQNNAYDQTHIQNTDFDHKDIENTVYRQNMVYDEIPSKDNTDYLHSQEEYNNVKYGQNVEEIREPVLPVETDINTAETIDNTYLQTTNPNIIPQEELTITSDSMVHESNEEENNNIADTNDQIYVEPDEIALTHDMNASDLINESNNEMRLEDDPTALPVNNDYAIETVSAQGYTSESVQLLDGVNVNPEPQILDGNNDLTFDPAVEVENANTPGETFNNDQHEENLYNEQTENYDYTEENVTENYNSEYSAPTENYQQNDEYAYYEGAQPEQPYTGINENEETTQQYDQNYEQQYGTAYDPQAYQQEGYNQEYAQGYEQQGYVDPQQQYETVDETQQDLQYESQDNLTAQYVEQQLDHEESYVENLVNKTEGSISQNDPQEIPMVAEQQEKVQ